ncbi:hypothetical protein [Maribellus sediminis]|uniref:hypothetical protein n=1 Tax=Maribellus sediminis TaxID=2696285 RepID=UPI00142F859F|nr:hypothetical protein [Maribellus sediminis]
MIDYVKIVIRDKKQVKRIWSTPQLKFYSEKEQIVKTKKKTFHKRTYLGLVFTLLDDRLEITGSLHKYFNNGSHNANDFSITNCIQTVSELKKVFDLDLKSCQIINLEFGLNILPTIDIKELINNLIYYGKNEFRSLPDIQYAKQAGSYNSHKRLNEYKIIKAYAKGFQHFDGLVCCDYNTLRFEIKSKQSKYINHLDVFSLEDLISFETYKTLATEIIKAWNDVILIDKNLPRNDHRLEKYKSLDFWHESLNRTRNSFSRTKQSYFKLLNEFPSNAHRHIQDLIEKKLNIFVSEFEGGANSTSNEQLEGAISTDSNLNYGADSTTEVKSIAANSTIVKLEPAPRRLCLTTGLPIEMQDSNSKFLTPVGLEWYFNNKPLFYEKLKRQFLPRSGISGKHTRYEKDELEHLAKQIRNHYHNPKRYLNKEDTDQLSLFS